ncbi:MAG: hypothetical protein E7Z91_06025 [Cyanobacteria bacterium SIG30]|nr:hypothetical protein [Cyanobacteria bacterium SIG30]
MGLSASQARFLMLTAQKSDTEFQVQQISHKRMLLANNSEVIQQKYTEKTNNQILSYRPYASSQYVPLTYEAFTSDASLSSYKLIDVNNKIVVADASEIKDPSKKDNYVIDENLLKREYFEDALKDRMYFIGALDENNKMVQKSIAGISNIAEVYDDSDDAAAKTEYDNEMTKIQNQDKKLELEIDRLETKHKAIETEIESVQSVIDKNVENGFATFG